MSRNRSRTRKKGVDFKKPKPVDVELEDARKLGAVLAGDIYLSVVASLGFDPLKEAKERRHLSS